MDFSWMDAIIRGDDRKKDKLRRKENKKVLKEVKQRNVSKSLKQHRNVYFTHAR